MIQSRESTSCVGVCESRAHAVFNQSSGGSFPSYAISVAFARWNFLLHAAKKNNNSCHCPRDMAMRMREVLARLWVGVGVPLALSLHYFQCDRIKFNLFFINCCISGHF